MNPNFYLEDQHRIEQETADELRAAAEACTRDIEKENKRYAAFERRRKQSWTHRIALSELRAMRVKRTRAAYERRRASR